ncbi:MAG TPA: hypothetical protein VL400_03300, partial [Polyangiaceae bacterium]|nr:hypothetical protein [Polyangiaceae bacterium]
PASSPFGMGWRGLDSDWIESGIASARRPAFDAWASSNAAVSRAQRLGALLSDRGRVLRSIPPDDDGFMAGCVSAALARAQREAGTFTLRRTEQATALIGLIDGAATRSPEETYLLADLLADRPPNGVSAQARFARSIDLFSKVATDPHAARELRARAVEQTARLYFASERQADGVAALERVRTMTQDPELIEDTLDKLADFAKDDATSEKRLLELVALEQPKRHGYPLSRNLGRLAEVQLRRGALDAALVTAAACANAENGDFEDDPDPWGCAPTLAEAMAELGGPPDGVTVPRALIGPLSGAVMEAAIARLDRDGAAHVGELLLREDALAPQVPYALHELRALASDGAAEAALATRLERVTDPDSEWHAAQVARLARRSDPARIDQTIGSLVAWPTRVASKRPTSDDDLREEVRERAEQVVDLCAAELAATSKDATLVFDTRGAAPRATANGVPRDAAACLARGAKSRFRSLGPMLVSVTLHRRTCRDGADPDLGPPAGCR